jgi:hypothetical protein
MKQIVDQKELIGKTIVRTGDASERFFIFFSDNTFCVLESAGWDDHYVQLDTDIFNQQPAGYGNEDLLELGFITKEQDDEARRLYTQQLIDNKKNEEIATLKELAKKYPDQL